MSGKTPLQKAVDDLNVSLVEDLLSSGADVNQRCANGSTLLHKLASKMVDAWTQDPTDLLKITELFLEYDADVNARDANGSTPFHAVVETGYTRGVYMFLKHDVDINAKDNNGDTPLNVACRIPELKVVWLLVDQGADVNNACTADGSTPAHWASLNCYKLVIKYLLEHGARVNALDFDGRSPLMWVLKPAGFVVRANTKVETLRFLLKNGADVNVIDSEGKNILSIGQDEDENKDCYKVLLEHIAKMKALGVVINPSLLDTIDQRKDLKKYFAKCRKELVLAKNTQIHPDYPVTFLDLMTNNSVKLMGLAGNTELIDRVNEIFGDTEFYIYGDLICKNLGRGMKRRVLFDVAAKKLKQCLPMADVPSSIIEKVLKSFGKKDLMRLYHSE